MKRTVVLVGLVVSPWIPAGSSAATHAFDDALVAHWAFNDGVGQLVHDASTNAFHAEHSDALWTNGLSVHDGALAFGGIDQAVYVPDAVTPPPSMIGDLDHGSIAVRFSFPATGSGDIIPIFYFGEGDTGTVHNSLILEVGHGGNPGNRKLYFTIVNARFCYDSGENLLPDRWYHFVAVVGPTGNTGYLDGQEMTGRHYNLGSDATYTNFFSSVPVAERLSMAYGRYGQEDPFFFGPGTLSDLRIYDRTLTAGEVVSLFEDRVDDGLFRASGFHRGVEPDELVLSWMSDTNYLYSVDRTDDLGVPSWGTVSNCRDLTGMPATTCTLSIPAMSTSGVYRIRATPR